MRRQDYVRGLLGISILVLVMAGAAQADHAVTFSQQHTGAGGTAIMGTTTSGTLSGHVPVGVWGRASATSGITLGVLGESSANEGYGVYGFASATSGPTTGVHGDSSSTGGRGVTGFASALSGATYGLYGVASSTSGTGVYGQANAATGSTFGVFGIANSPAGTGVHGAAFATSGSTVGVYGSVQSSNGRGVYGINSASSATASAAGVYGLSLASSGVATGVYGEANSSIGRGVVGRAKATSGATRGVVGRVDSASGIGVLGDATHASGGIGVQGIAASPNGFGIWSQGHARVEGNLHVNGNITKTGAGELVLIEDPERQRRVVYASVIGPRPATYVSGSARLTNGVAVIVLPDHFAVATAPEGLTVALTPTGEWLQLYVQTKSVRRLVVREASGKSGTFDYRVEGIRKGYEGHQVVVSRR